MNRLVALKSGRGMLALFGMFLMGAAFGAMARHLHSALSADAVCGVVFAGVMMTAFATGD